MSSSDPFLCSPTTEQQKFIFVTGGVISSLGKGVVAASIGALLETRGLRVVLTKADPYLNVDPGTINPLQHGEVFVTDDGAETDLDLGHYERFISLRLQKKNSFTTGQVYDAVLTRERQGGYLGRTVQVVPHITDQIKHNIYYASTDADISIVEIGGTVGDIESLPFLETIRQIRWELGGDRVAFCHVALVPYVPTAMELKTKPTQHSVRDLRQLGIQPDILVCRSDRLLTKPLKEKIALFCNVPFAKVFESTDIDSIYKLPLHFHRQGLDHELVKNFNIWCKQPDLQHWQAVATHLNHPKDEVKLAIVGKYTGVMDSYKSIYESLTHAGIGHQVKVAATFVDAENITDDTLATTLAPYHGIVIPGGFGDRGARGKIKASYYSRIHNIPFLGICMGMQIALIDIAQNLLNLPEASSQEFDPQCSDPVIYLMESQKDVAIKGGSMRLGAYPCTIAGGSLAAKIYTATDITERHRHRYEFNTQYRTAFEEAGVCFSGTSPDGELMEMVELKQHPFFVGCQFHPELKSRPMSPHPLFYALIKAALAHKHQATAATGAA